MPIFYTGDFNIHVNVKKDPNVVKYGESLAADDLTQHVDEVMHKSVHILDLVLSRSSEDIVRSLDIFDPSLSVYYAVHCTLKLSKPNVVSPP